MTAEADEGDVAGVDPRRAARLSLAAGGVVLGGGAVGVVPLGADPIALALLAVGATLLGGGGGVLMSLPPAQDEGDREPEEPPAGEVVSALAGGEEFERDRADGDGAGADDEVDDDGDAVDGDDAVEGDGIAADGADDGIGDGAGDDGDTEPRLDRDGDS